MATVEKYQLGDYRDCLNLECQFMVWYTTFGWAHVDEYGVDKHDHVAEPRPRHKHFYRLTNGLALGLKLMFQNSHVWACDCDHFVYVGKLLWTAKYVGTSWPKQSKDWVV